MARLLICELQDAGSWHEIWPTAVNLPESLLVENRTYYIELREVDSPDSYDLYVDDLPLRALRSPSTTSARWLLEIGFYAGAIEFVVKQRHLARITTRVEFSPSLAKLTREHFDKMVGDLLSDTTTLFALSPFRLGVARGSGDRPPPIARLEYLRSRMTAIERAVHSINAHRVRILRGRHERLDITAVRKIIGKDLSASFRTGALRLHKNPTLERRLGTIYLPAVLNRRNNVVSFDIQEHRAIKSAIKSWVAWLKSAAASLSTRPISDEDQRQQASVWRKRCLEMASRLERLLRLDLFTGVADQAANMGLSPVFRWQPDYNSFYRLHRDFTLGIARVFGDFLNLPLSHTYTLYELWVFIRLARAASRLFNLQTLDVGTLFDRDTNDVVIRTGTLYLKVRPDLTIAFQRRYNEYWLAEAGQPGSFSRTMVPDICIEHAEARGGTVRVLVLDAKYRINYQLNEAISSLHTYRDAIVRSTGENGNTIEKAVIGSYIVTPHVPTADTAEGVSGWKSERMPARLFHPEYRGRFKFGAVTLHPGMALIDFEQALRTIFRDSEIPIVETSDRTVGG
jgi:hypothetical protein